MILFTFESFSFFELYFITKPCFTCVTKASNASNLAPIVSTLLGKKRAGVFWIRQTYVEGRSRTMARSFKPVVNRRNRNETLSTAYIHKIYLPIITNPTIARSYWWRGVTLIKWHNWSFIILGHFNPNSCNSLVPLSPSSFFPTSAHPSSPSLHLNNKSVLWPWFLRSFADRSRFLR